MTPSPDGVVLSDEIIAHCGDRAAGYDRDNRFFTEDFEELRAADLRRMGDASLEWMLREAAAGEVFAAGHGEAGNDLPLFLSTAKAERADGGYRFWGHKTFSSLTPVWTRLGLHAMHAADPGGPKIVHAFLSRDAKSYQIKETWDTLGMRATRSDDTVLDGAFIPDRHVARVVPAGTADLFVLAIFGWAEPTFASI